MRPDGRKANALRPITFRRHYTRSAPGSVLVSAGRTVVLCTASIDPQVPHWLVDKGTGWVTAEYSMLPGSSQPRKPRQRDGRTAEIQRLIGRSLRAVVDLAPLADHTIWLDCDVLEADGGTRTASITGAFIALVDALWAWRPELITEHATVRDSVAAVSAGIVDGAACLDLNYEEDARAEVDFNIVMTGSGRFVEVQGTAEGSPFSRKQLDALLRLGRQGIEQLTALQRHALGPQWPLPT